MKEIKDFCKWLGVNEKIAKVAVWMLLIMISLIIVNAALDSLGFPYYKITADNLSHIDSIKFLGYICNNLVGLLNFYCIIFLVFSIKDFKKIFKYSLIYLFINIIITKMFNYAVLQIYIVIFILAISYFISGKKLRYILYSTISIIINIIFEYIIFYFKLESIDFSKANGSERFMLSLDYFIIMLIIISIKEIIINKKRGEKKWATVEQEAYYGLENSTKKNHLQKKSQQN